MQVTTDNFYACDKHAAMYGQIFAMYASDTRFYAWINVCHASKFTIFFFFFFVYGQMFVLFYGKMFAM
jgi:hypothetical protein